jgi:hypothetical protein
MASSETSNNTSVPAVQGLAELTSQGTAGVGVFGGVGLPDTGLTGAPPLSFVGVYGSAATVTAAGIGVYGASGNGNGVYGFSTNADGLVGATASEAHAGVVGRNTPPSTSPVQPNGPAQASGVGVFGSGDIGVQGVSSGGTGVQGASTSGSGVVGLSSSPTSGAIAGISSAFDGIDGVSSSPVHAGIAGRNSSPNPGPSACGVYGVGGTYAGKFDGNLQVNGNSVCTGTHTVGTVPAPGASIPANNLLVINGHGNLMGTLTVGVDIVLSAAASDCAEEFEIASPAEAEPGTVMVLDDAGSLRPSSQAYDRKVAGVVSGAGCYRPGIVLGRGEGSPTRRPVALVGKVFCKVDAQYGSVEVGDLLTTSPTPGHAMSAQDRSLSFGAVIGKALQRLSEGCGLVPILVALQ